MTRYAAGYTGPMLPSAGPRKGVIGSTAATNVPQVVGPRKGRKGPNKSTSLRTPPFLATPTPLVAPTQVPAGLKSSLNKTMMNKGGAVAKKTAPKKR